MRRFRSQPQPPASAPVTPVPLPLPTPPSADRAGPEELPSQLNANDAPPGGLSSPGGAQGPAASAPC